TNSAHAGEVLTKEKIAPSDVYALLRNRKFWAFCLYVAGVACMMFIAEQQFSRYFVTLFDDIHEGNAVFGYLGTVQSGMEFVMYMVVPLFVNFIGAKRGLLIVGLVVGARLIISGMCDSHLLISVLKPLYGLEICLLLVSVFKYIAEHFDKRVNATMYLLGYQAMLYVGNVVVSSPAGYMYDRIGFEHTYIIMGATALTFTLISAFTLSACQSKWRGARALNVAETSTR
ncbi:MFS transporter, partial [Enterobacteriaceae bacterium TzEc013]|nr:MFS transporter [Enterobacteriaceae bacterium TzEc013]